MTRRSQRHTLVVGGAGLIGQRLSRLLAQRGDHVTATVRRDDRRAEALRESGVGVAITDLSTPAVEALPLDRFDTVVYLAQSPRFREIPGGADDMISVNVAGAVQIARQLSLGASAATFVYASTGAVYAANLSANSESSAVAPPGTGFYAASKIAGEYAIRALAQQLRTIIVRPFFVYGTGMNETMLINNLFRSISAGKAIMLHGDSDGLRFQPTAADDAALQIAALVDSDLEGGVVNVVGDRPSSLRGVATMIGEVVGVEPIFEHVSGPVQSLLADDTLVRSIAGPCQTSLRVGLREMQPS